MRLRLLTGSSAASFAAFLAAGRCDNVPARACEVPAERVEDMLEGVPADVPGYAADGLAGRAVDGLAGRAAGVLVIVGAGAAPRALITTGRPQ